MKTTRREFVGAAAATFVASGASAQVPSAEVLADDTDTLQAILDKDHVLDLEPGTYRLTKSLVLDTARTGYGGIRGPQGTARLVMAGSGPAVQVVGDHQGTAEPKSVQAHTWEKERFPVLSGFEIVGAHEEAEGVVLIGTMQALVEGLCVRRCRHGVRLTGRNHQVTIANCQLYDNAETGIFMDNLTLQHLNITGNHISHNRRAGIRQLNGDVRNVQITGNDIEYNGGSSDGGGEILIETPGAGVVGACAISGNTLQGRPADSGANVAVLLSGKSGPSGGLAITGNVIGGRKRNVVVRNADAGMTIAGNTISMGADGGVVLEQCANVLVNGNIIRGSNEGPAVAGGVRLEDCQGCAVSDNIVVARAEGETPCGSISLLGCRAVSASCNQVLQVQHRGVYLQDCTHCRVVGNTLMPVENCPEFIAVAAEGVCEGNIIRDNFPCGKARET